MDKKKLIWTLVIIGGLFLVQNGRSIIFGPNGEEDSNTAKGFYNEYKRQHQHLIKQIIVRIESGRYQATNEKTRQEVLRDAIMYSFLAAAIKPMEPIDVSIGKTSEKDLTPVIPRLRALLNE